MNNAIVRLFGVVIVLFAVLVVWTSRATVFDATALQNNPLNKLAEFQSWKVKRGELVADDGQVLARSVAAGGGIWNRTYPFGSLFSQLVGYSNQQEGSAAGMEQYFTPQLSGPKSALAKVFGSFNGGTPVGDDVYTTLDPKAQKLAQELLRGRIGAAIAIVPQTGAVKVMYSNPTYNDNDPDAKCPPNALNIGCTFNMATQAMLPPGSTFKLVTTTAALDSGKYNADSIIVGNSPLKVSGTPLENDGNQSWGPVTLTKALTYSINTVYAQVGQNVGAQVMEKYMKRFGFYSTPPLQFPSDQMIASGEAIRRNGGYALIPPTDPDVDLGRMSIGQDKLAVTPLQMAMVVSAIANGGKLMEPRLATRVVNSDGQVVQTYPPIEYDQVMKPSTAATLTSMMQDVVEEGTGTAANVEGLKVAGKTGTASTGGYQDGEPLDDAWFVGFPVQDPRIAVAVTLENIPNGYGGTYAAPIAADLIKTLLAEHQ
ncbi:MAG TPA: penicillin-binding protein 2 [Solirubrobacteraceae bacterium]|nr:penicillin-binding protein 2 [Solirubrobacteraceae bacterium]